MNAGARRRHRNNNRHRVCGGACFLRSTDYFTVTDNLKHKAEIALKMYQERQRQINERAFMTEEESDKVVSGLLEYEQQLADKFQAQFL